MASYFWVGGSTAWDGTTNRFATSTGGTATVAAPGAGDTVTFDANSGSTAAVTTSVAITIGNCTLASGFKGSVTLGNTWTSGQVLQSDTNTFNTNGQTCQFSNWTWSGAGPTLTLGATVLTITGTGTSWNVATASPHISAASSTITLSGAGSTFSGGGNTYGTVNLTGSGTQGIVGTNTFTSLTRTGTAAVTGLSLSNNITVTNLTLTGNSPTNFMLLSSNSAGTQRTITASGTVTVTNTHVLDSIAAGTASPFIATSLGNVGTGNTNGWNFLQYMGTGDFTGPTGVTSVGAWCYAGGGGGGFGNGSDGGSGGGGGAFAFANVTITPGTVYTVTVGAAGTAANSAAGGNGGDSWFDTSGTVLAKGGIGGAASGNTAGTGGASGSCIGTIVFSGGNGVAGNATIGGAAGGGAGWQAAGGNGSSSTAGAAGNGGVAGNDPGKGGAGIASGSGTNGKVGVALSGGGGGGSVSSTHGGIGAAGLVALSYGTAAVNQVQLIMAASGNTAGTSAAVSWPSATTAGNLVVAIITSSASMATITPPSGWNLAVQDNVFPRIIIYYIQNASSRSGAETFTIASGRWYLELREYSGILTSSSLITTGSTSSSVSVTTGATSGNPATVNDLVVASIWQTSSNSVFSAFTATSGTVDQLNDIAQTNNSSVVFAITGGLSTGSTETISGSSTNSTSISGAIAIFGAATTAPFLAQPNLPILQAVNRAGNY